MKVSKVNHIPSPSFRAKTQIKEENSRCLPLLSQPKYMKSVDVNDHCKKKLTNKIPAGRCTRKDLSSLKRIETENDFQMGTGKSTFKFARKKSSPLGFMMVNSISRPSVKLNLQQILAVAEDQYQGLREYNQDRILSLTNKQINKKIYHFYAVFDGHGGSTVAEYLKQNLLKEFEALVKMFSDQNIGQLLKKALQQIEDEIIQSKLSGGSCASILVIHDNRYYVAHVGDSRILKLSLSKIGNSIEDITQLTIDHKPDEKKEKERIEGFGGKIYRNLIKVGNEESYGPYRVLPGKLSVSRSLGDREIKKQGQNRIVTCQPDIIQGQISPKDLFILMSDGAYQKFTNSQIAEFFSERVNVSLKKPLQTFFINSILRETSDNTSLICVFAQST